MHALGAHILDVPSKVMTSMPVTLAGTLCHDVEGCIVPDFPADASFLLAILHLVNHGSQADHAVDVAHSMLSCAEAHPYVIGAHQSYEYSNDSSRILTNYDSG
jgi:hypothetical protein